MVETEGVKEDRAHGLGRKSYEDVEGKVWLPCS